MKDILGLLAFMAILYGIIQIFGMWGTVAILFIIAVVSAILAILFAEPGPEDKALADLATEDADDVMKRAIEEANRKDE